MGSRDVNVSSLRASNAHLKLIWRINPSSLKVFGAGKVHGAVGEGEHHLQRTITMTLLNDISTRRAAPAVTGSAIRSTATSIGKLINRWIAAFIAHREYQANLALLRSFSDRELRDMGLDRCQIGEGLADAARTRSRVQQSRNVE
jgi:uncharacterized protein YjiS (DUF1127 family)